MFLLSLHKGRQTSKELKRNMNDGNYRFLMSLLIIFFIKKETLAQLFSCEFYEFSKNTFLTEFLKRYQLAVVTFVFQTLPTCSIT